MDSNNNSVPSTLEKIISQLPYPVFITVSTSFLFVYLLGLFFSRGVQVYPIYNKNIPGDDCPECRVFNGTKASITERQFRIIYQVISNQDITRSNAWRLLRIRIYGPLFCQEMRAVTDNCGLYSYGEKQSAMHFELIQEGPTKVELYCLDKLLLTVSSDVTRYNRDTQSTLFHTGIREVSNICKTSETHEKFIFFSKSNVFNFTNNKNYSFLPNLNHIRAPFSDYVKENDPLMINNAFRLDYSIDDLKQMSYFDLFEKVIFVAFVQSHFGQYIIFSDHQNINRQNLPIFGILEKVTDGKFRSYEKGLLCFTKLTTVPNYKKISGLDADEYEMLRKSVVSKDKKRGERIYLASYFKLAEELHKDRRIFLIGEEKPEEKSQKVNDRNSNKVTDEKVKDGNSSKVADEKKAEDKKKKAVEEGGNGEKKHKLPETNQKVELPVNSTSSEEKDAKSEKAKGKAEQVSNSTSSKEKQKFEKEVNYSSKAKPKTTATNEKHKVEKVTNSSSSDEKPKVAKSSNTTSPKSKPNSSSSDEKLKIAKASNTTSSKSKPDSSSSDEKSKIAKESNTTSSKSKPNSSSSDEKSKIAKALNSSSKPDVKRVTKRNSNKSSNEVFSGSSNTSFADSADVSSAVLLSDPVESDLPLSAKIDILSSARALISVDDNETVMHAFWMPPESPLILIIPPVRTSLSKAAERINATGRKIYIVNGDADGVEYPDDLSDEAAECMRDEEHANSKECDILFESMKFKFDTKKVLNIVNNL